MKAKKFTLKFLSVIAIIALAMSALLGSLGMANNVSAAEKSYFKAGDATSKTDLVTPIVKHGEDDVLKIVTKNKNDTAYYQTKVAANDLGLSFYMAEEVDNVVITLTTAPYYVNYEEETVSTAFTLKKEGGNLTVVAGSEETASSKLTGSAYNKDTAINLLFKVENNKLGVSFDGTNYAYTASEEAGAYVENFDKTMADLSFGINYTDGFDFATTPDTTTGLELVYIDNAASETSHGHRQTFALEGEATSPKAALAVIDLDDTFVKQGDDGSLKFIDGVPYTLTYNIYSALPSATTVRKSETILKSDTASFYDTNTSTRKAMFYGNDPLKIVSKSDEGIVYAEYKVDLQTARDYEQNEAKAPVYLAAYKAAEKTEENETVAYKLFKTALKNAIKDVKVGSDKTIEIPSLENLVSSDVTAYDKLDYTVHYIRKDSSTSFSTNSSLKVPVTEAGEYYFYVTFEDEFDNAMNEDMFHKKDSEGKVTDEYDLTADYMFSFTIGGEAEISVKGKNNTETAAEDWSKGVTRTAKEFEIEKSSGDSETYELFYKSGDEWVKIEKYESGKVKNYYTDMYKSSAVKYTDDDIASINYNGERKFTPNKTGMYKIVCTVSEKNSSQVASGETFINVKDVTVVVPATPTWVEENLASFIFLVIGGLALIGLIVVACIKPKDEELPKNKKNAR